MDENLRQSLVGHDLKLLHCRFRFPSKLLQEVCNIKPLTSNTLSISDFRLLLIGEVGSGKSSFFNTINSIFRGYVTSQAVTGHNADHSVTTMFRTYDVMSSPLGKPFKWKICDTAGLLPKDGLTVAELLYLVDGNIPNRFRFNPYERITPDSPGFIESPSHSQRAHCVTLVIDSSTVDKMPESMWQKYQLLQDALNARRIPLVVLLTKIDLACTQTRENLLHVFHSQRIQNTVRMISKKFQGLPTNKIFPIKNYEWETDLNTHVNSLSLLALRQMLRFAQDHIEEKADQFDPGVIRKYLNFRQPFFIIFVVVLFVLILVLFFFSDKVMEMLAFSGSGSHEGEENDDYE
ncbi:interferon-induced protein 44-like [Actinia tenebrosa]|uniref:Interferon-induced protein 44-like n=1 Tax=Actinia tenebrosa TaxID=6105 RepID=A0A6P8HLY0_ACTTE|nr:interferon-induced protein 44-like [Actinia tenebrosa]